MFGAVQKYLAPSLRSILEEQELPIDNEEGNIMLYYNKLYNIIINYIILEEIM